MPAYGLQLYTLRKPFAADPKGTLSRIHEIGYDAVEFAAPLSMDFADLGAHLRDIGLDCPSVHAGLDDMAQRPDAVLAMARHLGCRWIVLPFVMPDQRDWEAVIAGLNAFARRATAEDFRVAYHHHDFEFAPDADGTRPFDRLVAGTDPALVSFELDVFWLKRGGEDPLAMIRKMAGRVRLLHLKDYKADGGMDDVGAGTLDFPALLAAGVDVGVEHRFVEHDFPPAPYWPSVEASLRYLRGLG
ncbi:MAG: sugar phosphate isomerase/epimerase [Phenylobacterium sp.]|uniref:sugar phosphate isomerase/epimerase family protein n=1 Tax=Phenylobacterium sp. TaxID=1871053 RepID=UPI0025FA504D|nr:sugar phosphate isomerase/epimerase [Phenylobacterium sp.]MCA6246839.1 sugar phosphate isomerase/epimerase [Phenylobacterium sp.]